MYTIDGLRHGIERAKINIKALKDAIATEEVTIKDYKIMISQIEEAAEKKAEAEANIHVEFVNGETE